MSRLERVRAIVDKLLFRGSIPENIRTGFVHLYGVSVTAVLLARLRGLNEEIAGVMGMLHDLATFETGDPENHGPRSAARAKQILRSMDEFLDDEIERIQSAISHHSDKASILGPYEELLKDADVLHHDLYHMELYDYPPHAERRDRLRANLA